MEFVDEAEITVRGGDGGDGRVSFRREKYEGRGGPDGGHGGDGGDVMLRVDPQIGTLMDFRYQEVFAAEEGGAGGANNRQGASGDDVVVPVPAGTVITEVGSDTRLADLTDEGDSFTVAEGGRGGRGNAAFVSSRRQAPGFAEKGEPGEERRIRLELKLLADVGLVGFPNAGKSTLLSRISAAKPKVAAYQFTTISPNLGVVDRGPERRFVVADVPGLIEGAHQGVGLGDDFLRHLERTRVLVHIVDAAGVDGREPLEDLADIEEELRAYEAGLMERPRIIAANKTDLNPPPAVLAALEQAAEERDGSFAAMSAATGSGVDELLDRVETLLRTAPAPQPVSRKSGRAEEEGVEKVYGPPDRDPMRIEKRQGVYVVRGDEVERLVAMTDLGNDEAVAYLQTQFDRLGLEKRLRQAGADDGDTVRIGDIEFELT